MKKVKKRIRTPFKPDLTSDLEAVLREHIEEHAEMPPFISLRISARARRLSLRLDHKDRMIRFTVPHRSCPRKAARFFNESQNWINARLATLPTAVPFLNGAVVPVLGRDRTIKVTLDKTLKSTAISLNEKYILVSTNKADPSSRIRRFLETRAHEEIMNKALKKSEIINRHPAKIQVRDTKSRWGSCSSTGTLSFSWRLIFAPLVASDYVIAHEVAHMAHMNHGRDFWALCEELSEDFETGKRWMAQHGHTLMRYGAIES